MARINIEGSLWGDQEFQDLLAAVGNRHAAKGMTVELFFLAQKYWFPDKKPIPLNTFKRAGLGPTLDAGLAKLDADGTGVFVRGSEDAFAWLFVRQKGGRKSAKSREPEQPQLNCSQPPYSSLLSPSSFLTAHNSELLNLSEPAAKAARPRAVTSRIWDAYSDAYAHRYGHAPVRNAQVSSQLEAVVKRLGSEEAPSVAAFYLSHNDAFYVRSMHPTGLLLRDAEKLRTEWISGNKMLGPTAREVERVEHNAGVWDRAAAVVNAKIEEKKRGAL